MDDYAYGYLKMSSAQSDTFGYCCARESALGSSGQMNEKVRRVKGRKLFPFVYHEVGGRLLLFGQLSIVSYFLFIDSKLLAHGITVPMVPKSFCDQS